MSEQTTEEVQEEVVEEANPLGMSDEDILNMDEPSEITEKSITNSEESTDDGQEEETNEEEKSNEEEKDVVEESTETVIADSEDTTNEPTSEPEEDKTLPNDTTDSKKKLETEEISSEIDYKIEYERLMAPFKANGKEVRVNNADDVIRLMQMGSDYTAKMTSLKPNLKLMKMLENNNLLDEEKLSYLIDLDKKNPEAITKLIKDSGIDPLDVDVDADTNYNPSTYTVSDKEVELDDVLQSIESTDSYSKTIDIISNKWDQRSKEVLLKEPSIIKVINDHITTGIYDQINQIVENEKILGRLQGLSHLEAYKQVGDAIQANGGFAKQQQQAQPEATVPTTPNTPVIDTKIKDRKRAASSPKTAPSKKASKNFNPLAMSDEEFAKIAESDFN